MALENGSFQKPSIGFGKLIHIYGSFNTKVLRHTDMPDSIFNVWMDVDNVLRMSKYIQY